MKAETLNAAIEYACNLPSEHEAMEWIIFWELERAKDHCGDNLDNFNCYSEVYMPRIKAHFDDKPDDTIDLVAFRSSENFPYLKGDNVVKFYGNGMVFTRVYGTFLPIYLLPKKEGNKLLKELLKAKHKYQDAHLLQVKQIEDTISLYVLTSKENT